MRANGAARGKSRVAGTKTSGEPEFCIEVDGLVKVYGDVRAVDVISLKIRRGEVFAFLGPNGAGKTTTVEIIETIRSATEGTIRLMGMDVRKRIADIKRVIGVLPQEFSSFDKLRVHETLEFFASLYDRRADLDELLRMMDLTEHRDKLYQHLSGGLKRRVGIAVSLVNDPDVVFLDEPTTGLDPQGRHEVWTVISGLKKRGKTIFLTTHYMEEAEFLADHIAIISHGKIIAEGTVEELIERHGPGFRLNFKGVDDGFNAAVAELGVAAEGLGDDRCLTLKDKDGLLRVLEELRKRNVKFTEFNVRRADLEEVFLKLTGERLEAEGK
jgi:ABC-2 type transport system ATP-binding protein